VEGSDAASHQYDSISSRLPTYVSGSKLPGALGVNVGPAVQPASPMTDSAKAPCPRSRKNVRRLMTLVDPVMARVYVGDVAE
jgi:hypothetical protein